MAFDPLVVNPGRLRILTALAVEERQEFVQLRHSTQLTDGNLASHARRLETGGLVAIEKRFREGKPVTQIMLTPAGRKALESHVRRMIAALSQRRIVPSPTIAVLDSPQVPLSVGRSAEAAAADEEWVD